RRPVPPVERPALNHERQTFEDLRGHFVEVLQTVGGEAITVSDGAALNAELEKLIGERSAEKIVSLVPGIRRANVDLSSIDRPHELEDVDYAILPGRFGVAENAAVWLDLRSAQH